MNEISRRRFIKNTGIGTGAALFAGPSILQGKDLNGKIRVACIGVGGKGSSDTDNAAQAGGEIVAICDVDAGNLAQKAKKYPKAKKFTDFRKMLEEMDDQIDAVTVSTPDHVHAVASMMAIGMGKHIYCQKPLTQTVWESRAMRKLARDKKIATQMGNQGSAAKGLRRAVEVIQAGVIGNPLQIHVWSNRPIWPQGMDRPKGEDPVPSSLDWDLWIGPAAMRPYKKGVYNPFKWRGWTDFGTGALGDMACHTVNMPFRACKLGYPTMIECEMASLAHSESYPLTSRVRFDFPSRDGLPPLKFWWYDGNPRRFQPLRPYPDTVADVMALRNKLPPSGCLIIGEKGQLFSPDDYGARFFLKLEGEKKFTRGDTHEAVKPIAQTIPRSPGHVKEWFEMMKGGPASYSNFEIAAYLNEIILLGNIAQRVGEGRPIQWDGPNMKSPNTPEASKLVKRNYRKGWAPV